MNLVRAVHKLDEAVHRAAHFFVVERAYIEEKFRKCFLRHVRKLCHRRVRIAQNHPFGAVYAVVERRACHLVVKIEFFGRHIAELCGVFISADGNVRVHSFHLIKLAIVEELQLLLVAAQQHFAHQAAVPGSHIRLCAELVAVLDKLADKRPGGFALVID